MGGWVGPRFGVNVLGKKILLPFQDLNFGLSAHSILTVLTALCRLILVPDFIYSLLPVTGKLASTTGITLCANLCRLAPGCSSDPFSVYTFFPYTVAAFVWRSEPSHMDWGWENGNVLWHSTLQYWKIFVIAPPEFVVALSCTMAFSTGVGHFLLTADIGSIAEWLVILHIHSVPVEACIFMVNVEDTFRRSVVVSLFVRSYPCFIDCSCLIWFVPCATKLFQIDNFMCYSMFIFMLHLNCVTTTW